MKYKEEYIMKLKYNLKKLQEQSICKYGGNILRHKNTYTLKQKLVLFSKICFLSCFLYFSTFRRICYTLSTIHFLRIFFLLYCNNIFLINDYNSCFMINIWR